MKVIARAEEMRELASQWRRKGFDVGFVPTMGALHRGHQSLIRRARRENHKAVVSIFVNPLQFGPHEDYARYPRPFRADKELCQAAFVDAIFRPTPAELYPEGFRTKVEVESWSELLCGAFRPGHFRGVATVVLKLFNIVGPTRAYFGEKDFQQLRVIQRMVEDLNVPVDVVPCATVREPDGLALSSRNAYLGETERRRATELSRALFAAQASAKPGRPTGALLRVMRRELSKLPGAKLDYLKIIDPATLEDLKRLKPGARAVAALWLGRTRLIDNLPLL